MTLNTVPLAFGAVLALGACANPYDPGQRAVGGGLLGTGTGAFVAAATTPAPPPPRYYPQGNPQGGSSRRLDLADMGSRHKAGAIARFVARTGNAWGEELTEPMSRPSPRSAPAVLLMQLAADAAQHGLAPQT